MNYSYRAKFKHILYNAFIITIIKSDKTMSQWQDIFSVSTWEKITSNTTIVIPSKSLNGKSTTYYPAQIPECENKDSLKKLISKITSKIKKYHKIPKTEIEQFDARIKKLEEIEKITQEYIKLRGKLFCHKLGKKINPISSSSFFAQSQTTNVFENNNFPSRPLTNIQPSKSNMQMNSTRRTTTLENEQKTYIGQLANDNSSTAYQTYDQVKLGHMDQWIESLHKRTQKKSMYLKFLKTINLLPREDLISLINAEHQDGKMYPGALLEKLDPCHRQIEFDPSTILKELKSHNLPMNFAYKQWVESGDKKNFFIWLEKHSISTSYRVIDPEFQKISQIEYNLKDNVVVNIKENPATKQNELIGQRQNNAEKNEEPYPLNTSQLIKGDYIHCYKIIGNKEATAFIWDKDDENKFITHPHLSGLYSHASLVKGDDVRCAGMWVVKDGIVAYINNSSGHYRNSSMKFYQLISFLNEKGLIDENTQILDVQFGFTLEPFCLSKYLAKVEELGIASFPSTFKLSL